MATFAITRIAQGTKPYYAQIQNIWDEIEAGINSRADADNIEEIVNDAVAPNFDLGDGRLDVRTLSGYSDYDLTSDKFDKGEINTDIWNIFDTESALSYNEAETRIDVDTTGSSDDYSASLEHKSEISYYYTDYRGAKFSLDIAPTGIESVPSNWTPHGISLGIRCRDNVDMGDQELHWGYTNRGGTIQYVLQGLARYLQANNIVETANNFGVAIKENSVSDDIRVVQKSLTFTVDDVRTGIQYIDSITLDSVVGLSRGDMLVIRNSITSIIVNAFVNNIDSNTVYFSHEVDFGGTIDLDTDITSIYSPSYASIKAYSGAVSAKISDHEYQLSSVVGLCVGKALVFQDAVVTGNPATKWDFAFISEINGSNVVLDRDLANSYVALDYVDSIEFAVEVYVDGALSPDETHTELSPYSSDVDDFIEIRLSKRGGLGVSGLGESAYIYMNLVYDSGWVDSWQQVPWIEDVTLETSNVQEPQYFSLINPVETQRTFTLSLTHSNEAFTVALIDDLGESQTYSTLYLLRDPVERDTVCTPIILVEKQGSNEVVGWFDQFIVLSRGDSYSSLSGYTEIGTEDLSPSQNKNMGNINDTYTHVRMSSTVWNEFDEISQRNINEYRNFFDENLDGLYQENNFTDSYIVLNTAGNGTLEYDEGPETDPDAPDWLSNYLAMDETVLDGSFVAEISSLTIDDSGFFVIQAEITHRDDFQLYSIVRGGIANDGGTDWKFYILEEGVGFTFINLDPSLYTNQTLNQPIIMRLIFNGNQAILQANTSFSNGFEDVITHTISFTSDQTTRYKWSIRFDRNKTSSYTAILDSISAIGNNNLAKIKNINSLTEFGNRIGNQLSSYKFGSIQGNGGEEELEPLFEAGVLDLNNEDAYNSYIAEKTGNVTTFGFNSGNLIADIDNTGSAGTGHVGLHHDGYILDTNGNKIFGAFELSMGYNITTIGDDSSVGIGLSFEIEAGKEFAVKFAKSKYSSGSFVDAFDVKIFVSGVTESGYTIKRVDTTGLPGVPGSYAHGVLHLEWQPEKGLNCLVDVDGTVVPVTFIPYEYFKPFVPETPIGVIPFAFADGAADGDQFVVEMSNLEYIFGSSIHEVRSLNKNSTKKNYIGNKNSTQLACQTLEFPLGTQEEPCFTKKRTYEGLDLESMTQTVLYTVEDSKIYPTKIRFIVTSAGTVTSFPSVQIGTNITFDNIMTSTALAGLNTVDDSYTFVVEGKVPLIGVGEDITIDVTAAADDTLVANVELIFDL